MKSPGSRKKHSLVRTFLYSLFLLSALPVVVLGYLWIDSDFDRFTSQHLQWRETYTDSRNQLLQREVKKALEYIRYRRDRFDQEIYKSLRGEMRNALVLARDIRVSSGDADRAQLRERVVNALAPLRFGDEGFYYVLDGSGEFWLTPVGPDGKARLPRTAALAPLARSITGDADAKTQRFLRFDFPGDGGDSARNISFVFHYKPMDVYVVASVYAATAMAALKAEVLERLSVIPYDPDTSVLFVTDVNGVQLVNPYNPEMIGQPLPAVRAWSETHRDKSQSGFTQIQWQRSEEDQQASVQSYLHYDAPWDWVIGAGYFLDEFNHLIELELAEQEAWFQAQLRFILLISLGLLLLGVLIARLLFKRVEDGFHSLEDFFDSAAKRSINISLSDLSFAEFQDLAEHANYMVDTRSETEAKLTAARIEAEDASHAKSQFLSSVSHELRTPLNGVLGYTQLLLRSDGIAPQERRHLEAIETCGTHLLTLINDVLDLAKIESGNMELDTRSHRLSAVIGNVGDIVRQRAQAKGLRYEVNLDPDIPGWLQFDAVKLRQILVNLLDNAVKFTESGFVELTVTASPDKSRLCFAVRDTGRGIEADKLQEVFEPFKQTNPHEGRGTGLGLSICFRLVETMGGALAVESEFGKGTVFSFDLPLIEGAAQVAAEEVDVADELRSVQLRFERDIDVIIADDNNFNRQVMRGMVQGFASRIREANDGDEVLELLAERTADVVLMDLKMPGLDGVEATRRMREDQRFKDICVVMVTATIEANAINAAHQAGCNGFLAKPVQLSELLHTLAELLDGELVTGSGEPDEIKAVEEEFERPVLEADIVAEIRSALAIGDIKALRGCFEAIAGESRAHGKLAQRAQHALDEFDLDAIAAMIDNEAP